LKRPIVFAGAFARAALEEGLGGTVVSCVCKRLLGVASGGRVLPKVGVMPGGMAVGVGIFGPVLEDGMEAVVNVVILDGACKDGIGAPSKDVSSTIVAPTSVCPVLEARMAGADIVPHAGMYPEIDVTLPGAGIVVQSITVPRLICGSTSRQVDEGRA
jgi:hypothetical protein